MTTRAIRPMARMLPRAMWPSTEIPPRVPGTPSFLCQADLCEISMVSPNSPKRRKILPRFGAIGKHGSIAVIERFIRTFKAEGLRRLILLPLGAAELNREIRLYVQWFNAYRAHTARTARRRMSDIGALRQPAAGRELEPRPRWPRDSLCAEPQAKVRGEAGAKFDLHVEFLEGRKHLPTVSLKRVA